MTFNDLIAAGKISRGEQLTFALFNSDIGKEWLKKKIKSSFMETPDFPSGEGFAYIAGRQSILKDIQHVLDNIENKLKEVKDGTSQQQRNEFDIDI